MNYAIKILEEELSKLVKLESIFVFEHPDFEEENNKKILSIKEALKLLNEESLSE